MSKIICPICSGEVEIKLKDSILLSVALVCTNCGLEVFYNKGYKETVEIWNLIDGYLTEIKENRYNYNEIS